MGIPTIIGGASALIGLLGKKKNYNSGPDLSAGRADLSALGGVRSQYADLSGRALTDYGTDQGDYRSALTNQEDYLKEDPYTDSRDAADLAGATDGVTQATQRANANTSASLARRGITDSSELGGAIASNENRQASLFASASNKLAYQKIAARNANAAQLTSLTGGAAGQDYSKGVSALGAEGSIDGNLASTELNLGEREQGLEGASNSGLDSALGAAGATLGQGVGFGGGGLGPTGAGGLSSAQVMALIARQKQQGTPIVGGGVGNASFNTYRPGG